MFALTARRVRLVALAVLASLMSFVVPVVASADDTRHGRVLVAPLPGCSPRAHRGRSPSIGGQADR